MSKFSRPGSRRRGCVSESFGIVYCGAIVNALVSNQRSVVRSELGSTGSLERFALPTLRAKSSRPVVSDAAIRSGIPFWNTVIPLNCQLPMISPNNLSTR